MIRGQGDRETGTCAGSVVLWWSQGSGPGSAAGRTPGTVDGTTLIHVIRSDWWYQSPCNRGEDGQGLGECERRLRKDLQGSRT